MSFKDSFTKEDTKEDLLGYDDTAFHYFAISVLACVAVPWTISLVYSLLFPGRMQAEKDFPLRSADGKEMYHPRTATMIQKSDEARKEARRCTTGAAIAWVVRIILLSGMWAAICGAVMSLGEEKQIRKFDPFDILDVTPQAPNVVIKRAYRKLSLIYHPDKNPDDPLAASRFIQITKAYQALTDEVAKRNWEKYGNPDGPQTTKVGIGLPRFLLEKDHHITILCAFFFVLLFMVPMTFICYYQQTKNYAANGVMIETLQFLGYYINETTRVKSCPELLAACGESRCMKTRPTDNKHLKAFGTAVHEHKKRSFTVPVVMKNQYLVWAHMQRLHHLMSPELRADIDELLGYSMRITQAMIEIACMREWFTTAQAIIDFRRCLVQALDVKSSQLLQVPHFNEERCALFEKNDPPCSTLVEFLALDAERRKKVLGDALNEQQLLDVDAFCSHVGKVIVKASVEVEDEPEIIVGDVATVTVQMLRKNLEEDQAMGASHAPLFPEPKFEEWWFFLVEATATSQTRIVHFERVTGVTRGVDQKLRFQVTKPGENKLILHALCDAYAGLDQKVELSFSAFAEEEFKREFKVHPEDEDLDLQPTLFQQFMGGELAGDDESEEEEEEEEHSSSGASAESKRRGNRGGRAAQGSSSSPSKAAEGRSAQSPKAGAAGDSPKAKGDSAAAGRGSGRNARGELGQEEAQGQGKDGKDGDDESSGSSSESEAE